MSGDYAEFQQYRRKLDLIAPVTYTCEPWQKVQLQTLFRYVIDRDVPNIRKFRHQGFANIFQAHEAKTGNTVMHVATYKNDVDLISFFLDEGADVDARNRGGTTPLMVAAHHGYLALVKLLLSKGANLDAEDRFGQNVLWYCFGGTERHAQIAAMCMEADAFQPRPNSNVLGKPVLVKACEKGNKTTEIVELLLRHGSDVNEPAIRTGRTPLIEAARRGSTSVMKLLLAKRADVDAVDYKQVHSAHEAAYYGHVPALQILAAAGAHLDTQSYNGNTPLHLAVSSQQLAAVRYLAHRGGNANAKNRLGLTPKAICKKYALKAAAKEMKKGEKQFAGLKEKFFCVVFFDWLQNNSGKLKTALESQKDEGNPAAISRDNLPPVLESVSAPLTEEEIAKLMEVMDPRKTGLISIPDLLRGDKLLPKGFRTAAYPAELKGRGKKGKKKPKLKFPKGFKIPICTTVEEETPMKFTDSPFVTKHVFPGEKGTAGQQSNEKSMPFADDSAWMLENISPDVVPINALCQLGDWDSVIRACQKGLNINQCDKHYKTPLMYAASAGRWEMVQMLLAYGANVNSVDNFGWTALHHACRNGRPVVLDELIQNRANVNQHTLAGATPLMKAIESNNLDCVLYCVVNGANLKARTVCGLSIQDYAKSFGNFCIYKVISRYLKAYRGGRNLHNNLAAIDPKTKFALGNRDLTYEYGKDIRGVFRRQRFLEQKTLLKDFSQADLPIRAVKPKANKIPEPIAHGVLTETTLAAETGPAKPPPRIPVTATGKPLLVKISKIKLRRGTSGKLISDPKVKPAKLSVPRSAHRVTSDDSYTVLPAQPAPATEAPVAGDALAQDRKQKMRKFFTEANKKFEALTGNPWHHPFSQPEITDPFAHDTAKFGRGTAWMLRNHVDAAHGEDLTFYAPAREDWYPPTNEEMVMRYQIKPGLFDWTIQKYINNDSLEKYVQKVKKQLEEDFESKRYFELSRLDDAAEKGMPKRFSITEELKKLRPMEGKFMNPDEILPSESLIDNFLGELKKEMP